MFKRSSFIRSISLAILTLFLTVGCTQLPNLISPSTNSTQSQRLISATNNWVGYSGHHVAVGKKFFVEEGLDVQDLFFDSVSEHIDAFLAGEFDLGWFTSGDAVEMIAKDPSIKIIYLVDYSDGGDGIVGRGIQSPADVKGKTLAREKVLFHKVLLQAYLRQAGLTEADVLVKDLSAADGAAAFANKQVDIAVTYEPYMTKAAQQGGGEVIFSTKDTNLVADVVVARESLVQSRKADLRAYFRAVDKAVSLLRANDPEALRIAGDKLNVTADEMKVQLQGVKLFDLVGNQAIAFNKASLNSVIDNLEITAKAAYDFKMVERPLAIESLYDDSIIKSINVNTM
jgi:NitT/TauT family transport system substrate-binding protein